MTHPYAASERRCADFSTRTLSTGTRGLNDVTPTAESAVRGSDAATDGARTETGLATARTLSA